METNELNNLDDFDSSDFFNAIREIELDDDKAKVDYSIKIIINGAFDFMSGVEYTEIESIEEVKMYWINGHPFLVRSTKEKMVVMIGIREKTKDINIALEIPDGDQKDAILKLVKEKESK